MRARAVLRMSSRGLEKYNIKVVTYIKLKINHFWVFQTMCVKTLNNFGITSNTFCIEFTSLFILFVIVKIYICM